MWYEGPGDSPPPRANADESYYRGSLDSAANSSVIDLLREREALTPDSTKIVFIMVGDDQTARLSTAVRLSRFLAWRGADVEVFEIPDMEQDINTAVDGILQWMMSGGEIAIFDSENGSHRRRSEIASAFKCVEGQYFNSIGVVFIEVIPEEFPHARHGDVLRGGPSRKRMFLEDSKRMRLPSQPKMKKVTSLPTIRKGNGSPPIYSTALLTRTHRRRGSASIYETVKVSSKHSFLKIYNGMDKVMASRVYGRITKSILPFLMATSRRKKRPIWLVRAGCAKGHLQTHPNDKKLLISPPNPNRFAEIDDDGQRFASWLSTFVEKRVRQLAGGDNKAISKDEAPRLIDGRSDGGKSKRIKIMISSLSRALETASRIKWAGYVEQYPALNPLDKGLFPGLRFWDAQKEAPEFYRRWVKDKYNTRFPAGESYHDVRVRLESCLIEIEQQNSPVLVIAHGTVLQVLHCYFTGKAIEDCWKVSFPHHTVIEFSPLPQSARGSWSIRSFPMENDLPGSLQMPRRPPGPPPTSKQRDETPRPSSKLHLLPLTS